MQRAKVRITVLKKFKPSEVFGEALPISTDIKEACPMLEEGQAFIVDEDGKMPEKFCTWAWNDIYGVYLHLRYGGDFPEGWINDKGTVVSCCTDGLRPVIFKLERIQQ